MSISDYLVIEWLVLNAGHLVIVKLRRFCQPERQIYHRLLLVDFGLGVGQRTKYDSGLCQGPGEYRARQHLCRHAMRLRVTPWMGILAVTNVANLPQGFSHNHIYAYGYVLWFIDIVIDVTVFGTKNWKQLLDIFRSVSHKITRGLWSVFNGFLPKF